MPLFESRTEPHAKVKAAPMTAPVYLTPAGSVQNHDGYAVGNPDGTIKKSVRLEPQGGPGHWLVHVGGVARVVPDAEFRAEFRGVSGEAIEILAASAAVPDVVAPVEPAPEPAPESPPTP